MRRPKEDGPFRPCGACHLPGSISAQCSVEKIRFETGGKQKKVKKRKQYQTLSTKAERMRCARALFSFFPRFHCAGRRRRGW